MSRRTALPDGYDAAYAGAVSPRAPPLIEPAAEWGAFMGTSGNLRQQLIIGLERALEAGFFLVGSTAFVGFCGVLWFSSSHIL